jgi:hypothetical protein
MKPGSLRHGKPQYGTPKLCIIRPGEPYSVHNVLLVEFFEVPWRTMFLADLEELAVDDVDGLSSLRLSTSFQLDNLTIRKPFHSLSHMEKRVEVGNN